MSCFTGYGSPVACHACAVRLCLLPHLRVAVRWGFAASLVFAHGCSRTRELPPCDESVQLPQPPRDPAAVVVAAAGDIASCPWGRQDETAMLVEALSPDLVLALGDEAYPNGSLDDFLDCYDPSWGRFRSITRAAPGNHEYHAPHAGPGQTHRQRVGRRRAILPAGQDHAPSGSAQDSREPRMRPPPRRGMPHRNQVRPKCPNQPGRCATGVDTGTWCRRSARRLRRRRGRR